MPFRNLELLWQNLALNRTPLYIQLVFRSNAPFFLSKKFFREISGHLAVFQAVSEGTFSENLLIHRKDVIIKHGFRTHKTLQKERL